MSAVAANLARFEGRMLIRHPATVAGAVVVMLMVAVNLGSPLEADAYSALGGLGAATLGPFALLASNGAWQRSRRNGADELLSTMPAPRSRVRAGHWWSVTAPVVLAAVATAAAILAFRLGGVDLSRWPTLPELVQGPLAVGCAGILAWSSGAGFRRAG